MKSTGHAAIFMIALLAICTISCAPNSQTFKSNNGWAISKNGCKLFPGGTEGWTWSGNCVDGYANGYGVGLLISAMGTEIGKYVGTIYFREGKLYQTGVRTIKAGPSFVYTSEGDLIDGKLVNGWYGTNGALVKVGSGKRLTPPASQNESQSSYPQNPGASSNHRGVGGISNAYGLSNVAGSVKTMNECVIISDDEVKNRTAGSVHGGVMGSGADSARNGGRSWYVIQNVCNIQVRISWCFLGTDSDEIHPDACPGWVGLSGSHVFSPGEKVTEFHEGRHNGILYLASRMKSPTGEYMWCELTQRSIPVRRNAKVCCGVQGHNSCPFQKQIVYTRELALKRWVPK